MNEWWVQYLCWSAMTIGMSVYTAVSLSVGRDNNAENISEANNWQRRYNLLATIHQFELLDYKNQLFPTGKWGKRNFIWCLSLDCMFMWHYCLFVFSFSATFSSKAFVLTWRVTYQGNTTAGIKQSFQKLSLVSNTVQHVPEELSTWRHRFHPRGSV